MAPPVEEFNYNAIVEEVIKKNFISQQLETEKNTVEDKFWNATCKNFEEKVNFEAAVEDNKILQSVISEQIKTLTNINYRDFALNQKLKQLEDSVNEAKIKKLNTMKHFFNEIEELNERIKNIHGEFDNENIRQKIENNVATLKQVDNKIDETTKEMDALKSSIGNSEYVVEPTMDKITEIIQNESLQWYGEPMKLQKRLAEIKQHNQLLRKKIEDIKIKYDI